MSSGDSSNSSTTRERLPSFHQLLQSSHIQEQTTQVTPPHRPPPIAPKPTPLSATASGSIASLLGAPKHVQPAALSHPKTTLPNSVDIAMPAASSTMCQISSTHPSPTGNGASRPLTDLLRTPAQTPNSTLTSPNASKPPVILSTSNRTPPIVSNIAGRAACGPLFDALIHSTQSAIVSAAPNSTASALYPGSAAALSAGGISTPTPRVPIAPAGKVPWQSPNKKHSISPFPIAPQLLSRQFPAAPTVPTTAAASRTQSTAASRASVAQSASAPYVAPSPGGPGEKPMNYIQTASVPSLLVAQLMTSSGNPRGPAPSYVHNNPMELLANASAGHSYAPTHNSSKEQFSKEAHNTTTSHSANSNRANSNATNTPTNTSINNTTNSTSNIHTNNNKSNKNKPIKRLNNKSVPTKITSTQLPLAPALPSAQLLYSPIFQCYTSLAFYAAMLVELQTVANLADACRERAREAVWAQLFVLSGLSPAVAKRQRCTKKFAPLLAAWMEMPTVNLMAIELLYLAFAFALVRYPDLLKNSKLKVTIPPTLAATISSLAQAMLSSSGEPNGSAGTAPSSASGSAGSSENSAEAVTDQPADKDTAKSNDPSRQLTTPTHTNVVVPSPIVLRPSLVDRTIPRGPPANGRMGEVSMVIRAIRELEHQQMQASTSEVGAASIPPFGPSSSHVATSSSTGHTSDRTPALSNRTNPPQTGTMTASAHSSSYSPYSGTTAAGRGQSPAVRPPATSTSTPRIIQPRPPRPATGYEPIGGGGKHANVGHTYTPDPTGNAGRVRTTVVPIRPPVEAAAGRVKRKHDEISPGVANVAAHYNATPNVLPTRIAETPPMMMGSHTIDLSSKLGSSAATDSVPPPPKRARVTDLITTDDAPAQARSRGSEAESSTNAGIGNGATTSTHGRVAVSSLMS